MAAPRTLDPIRGAFRAVTLACVPAADALTPEAWERAEDIVDDALAGRPPSVRRQVVLFVRVVGLLARVRYGRALDRLDPPRTRALLGALERAPVLLLRRGTWGLRTLAFMGYYGQAEVRGALGYRAAPGGWTGRDATQGPWPQRRGAAPPERGVLTAGDAPTDGSGLGGEAP
ncbi:MAG TPA: hypothetical protein VJ997_08185 [Longimicrobiales bacterium]|nr:hypothetical protein [Longimicrobiales bacterium]